MSRPQQIDQNNDHDEEIEEVKVDRCHAIQQKKPRERQSFLT